MNKKEKIEKVFLIIIVIFINFFLSVGTSTFFSVADVTGEVIYPVKQTEIHGLTTTTIYECNIAYEYKGKEYKDTMEFNNDNLPEELKKAGSSPTTFDVKLEGYIYKDNPDMFYLHQGDSKFSKYIFIVHMIVIIPSIYIIIKNVKDLIKSKNKKDDTEVANNDETRTNETKKTNKKLILYSIIIAICILFIIISVNFSISKTNEAKDRMNETNKITNEFKD